MQQYKHYDQIISPYDKYSIFIGDLTSAQQTQWFKPNHIKTVVTAADGITLHYDKSIQHITYKLQDNKNQNVSKLLQEISDKIQRSIKQGSVLVHCGAGVSRSATLVIGYLIKYKHMTFLQALRLTKSKRSVICPNLGFQLQLKSFQKLLKSSQLINSIKQKNIQLPQIQKPFQFLNDKNRKQLIQKDKYILQNKHLLLQNRSQVKSNKNVGGGFVKKYMMKRQNSLVVGNRQPLSRQIQSNGFQQKYGGVQGVGARQGKDIQYLKKIAMFRFGITNTQKWKLG